MKPVPLCLVLVLVVLDGITCPPVTPGKPGEKEGGEETEKEQEDMVGVLSWVLKLYLYK